MMDENRLDNIVECAYNMDNGYVEVWYVDGNMLRIKCEEVEAALRTTEQSLAKLHKLLDNKPIEYVAMALSGLIWFLKLQTVLTAGTISVKKNSDRKLMILTDYLNHLPRRKSIISLKNRWVFLLREVLEYGNP